MSTRNRTLDEVGFIHCSMTDDQVRRVGRLLYGDCDESLCLLTIDPQRVRAKVVEEDLDGLGEEFPHIYGPLNTDAVIAVHDFVP